MWRLLVCRIFAASYPGAGLWPRRTVEGHGKTLQVTAVDSFSTEEYQTVREDVGSCPPVPANQDSCHWQHPGHAGLGAAVTVSDTIALSPWVLEASEVVPYSFGSCSFDPSCLVQTAVG